MWWLTCGLYLQIIHVQQYKLSTLSCHRSLATLQQTAGLATRARHIPLLSVTGLWGVTQHQVVWGKSVEGSGPRHWPAGVICPQLAGMLAVHLQTFSWQTISYPHKTNTTWYNTEHSHGRLLNVLGHSNEWGHTASKTLTFYCTHITVQNSLFFF